MYQFSTLIELLRYQQQNLPDKVAYKFVQNSEIELDSVSYQELDQQARKIAAYLQSILKPSDRALLLYQPGLEFIAAFFGCLYAEVIAVPAYPPRHNQHSSRLKSIITDAQAKAVLTTTFLQDSINSRLSKHLDVASIRWLTTDNIANELAADWKEPQIDGNTLAFLQYTSGSTGTPKGVMVSHHHLLHNEQMIKKAFGHTEKTVVVGWLPLYHDMGLIGNILQPLYLGRPSILMSPVAFLQEPFFWLQTISRYKA
ncbi:MAG: AMP-binding protein, partial [Microcystaceae cyanobacterium]